MIEETCPKCGSARVATETITANQAMFGREAIVPANWPVWDEPVNRKTCKECWHHWDEWLWDERPMIFMHGATA